MRITAKGSCLAGKIAASLVMRSSIFPSKLWKIKLAFCSEAEAELLSSFTDFSKAVSRSSVSFRVIGNTCPQSIRSAFTFSASLSSASVSECCLRSSTSKFAFKVKRRWQQRQRGSVKRLASTSSSRRMPVQREWHEYPHFAAHSHRKVASCLS